MAKSISVTFGASETMRLTGTVSLRVEARGWRLEASKIAEPAQSARRNRRNIVIALKSATTERTARR
jgi:hypothetical protein